eukprot:scaffold31985_cov19-Tisochrysis_lutea.AAC.1
MIVLRAARGCVPREEAGWACCCPSRSPHPQPIAQLNSAMNFNASSVIVSKAMCQNVVCKASSRGEMHLVCCLLKSMARFFGVAGGCAGQRVDSRGRVAGQRACAGHRVDKKGMCEQPMTCFIFYSTPFLSCVCCNAKASSENAQQQQLLMKHTHKKWDAQTGSLHHGLMSAAIYDTPGHAHDSCIVYGCMFHVHDSIVCGCMFHVHDSIIVYDVEYPGYWVPGTERRPAGLRASSFRICHERAYACKTTRCQHAFMALPLFGCASVMALHTFVASPLDGMAYFRSHDVLPKRYLMMALLALVALPWHGFTSVTALHTFTVLPLGGIACFHGIALAWLYLCHGFACLHSITACFGGIALTWLFLCHGIAFILSWHCLSMVWLFEPPNL